MSLFDIQRLDKKVYLLAIIPFHKKCGRKIKWHISKIIYSLQYRFHRKVNPRLKGI